MRQEMNGRWIGIGVTLGVVTLLAALFVARPSGAPRSARLSELLNDVRARVYYQSSAWEAAVDGLVVHRGGRVRTAEASKARLDISDGTIIRLAPSTEVFLQDLTPSTDPVTQLWLRAGKLWLDVAHVSGSGAFEIQTPTGVVAVRGTLLSVDYAPASGAVEVTCLQGQCQVAGTTGAAVDLSAGQQTSMAARGQAPAPAAPMTYEQYQDWLDNVPETQDAAVMALFPATGIHFDPPTNTCQPATAPAGVMDFEIGVGRWPTPAEAQAAVGDSWPDITVDGRAMTRVVRQGPEWHEGGEPAGYGFSSHLRIALGPGTYRVRAQWYWPDGNDCTLTVTAPG